MADLMVLTCNDCKVGLRVPVEEENPANNESRQQFTDNHVQHGAFSVETEEYFDQVLLAGGYKDAANPVAKPLPRLEGFKLDIPPTTPPFGMPKPRFHGQKVGHVVEQSDDGEQVSVRIDKIGPRPLQKFTCTGCPALKITANADLTNLGRLSTVGYCSEARQIIGVNWKDECETPEWCPAKEKSPE